MPKRQLAVAVLALALVQVGALVARVGDRSRMTDAGSHPAPTTSTTVVGGADATVVVSAQGVVLPVLGRRNDAWAVSTPCGNQAVVSAGRPLTAASVVIDPGHGGDDPGAFGPNGLTEAALNLAVARYAQAALERANTPVVLTRTGDYDVTLANRAAVATGLRARAFVSIHHNAGAEIPSGVPGTEVFYQRESADSKRLGGLVYEEVMKALEPYRLRWVSTVEAGVSWRTRTDGADYYAMDRLPAVPSALAELAYLSNPAEAELLASAGTQRAEGEAVARGVERFLATPDPGSGFVPGRTLPPAPSEHRTYAGCVDPAL